MVRNYSNNLEKMKLEDLEEAKNIIEKELFIIMKE